VLDHFEVATFHFTLSALQKIVLPSYRGSTFRGGFGSTFRKIVCTTKKQYCKDCIVRQKCSYSYIFETPPPRDSQIMRKYPHVPHPFVIEPPEEDKNQYAEGEEVHFGLVLIGKAIEYLPYFIYTFEELGKKGLGMGHGKYCLESVYIDSDGSEKHVIYGSSGR
jgi:hypothetical protein